MGYQVGFSFYPVLVCINEDTENQKTQQPVAQGGRSPQRWGMRAYSAPSTWRRAVYPFGYSLTHLFS